MNDDLRYLHKWLNEEQTAPIDRVALAKMLAFVTELEEGAKFFHEIENLKDQLATEKLRYSDTLERLITCEHDLSSSQQRINELEGSLKKPCPTCEALARTVMMDQVGRS
jgi:hypothetical protein